MLLCVAGRRTYINALSPKIRRSLPPTPLNCIDVHHVNQGIPQLRHLVDILSDAVTRIDEKYASANLEFPALDKSFDEKDPACLLLSGQDVVPLSSVVVAAADQSIACARHPMQTVLDIAQLVSALIFFPHRI